MKTIAVIPVHGRLPLLPYTIGRLYTKNNISHVICVGSEAERAVCEKAGAQYLISPNTLGLKWNNGFEEAGRQKAEVIVFVGSSDWLSDTWIERLLPYMETFDMVGKLDFNMVHVNHKILLCNWPGYPKDNERHGEPIGIGRMLRAEVLDRMKWRPFKDTANNSMDWQMLQSVGKQGGHIGIYTGEDIQSLSLSTDQWVNKHKFFSLQHRAIEDGDKWIKQFFPEVYQFHADINNR